MRHEAIVGSSSFCEWIMVAVFKQAVTQNYE